MRVLESHLTSKSSRPNHKSLSSKPLRFSPPSSFLLNLIMLQEDELDWSKFLGEKRKKMLAEILAKNGEGWPAKGKRKERVGEPFG